VRTLELRRSGEGDVLQSRQRAQHELLVHLQENCSCLADQRRNWALLATVQMCLTLPEIMVVGGVFGEYGAISISARMQLIGS